MLEISEWKVQKGPCCKISFSILSGGSTSDEKVIDYEFTDLGIVKFKFQNTREEGRGLHIVYVSMMKHESDRNFTIRVSVTCEKTTIQSQCDWTVLGRNWVESQHGVFVSDFEVYIYAYKVKIVGFANLYEDTDLTDFKLSTPDGSVSVHKACLAAHSDYFKRMLMGKWKETQEGSIDLKGVNLSHLQLLKKYLYLGTMPEDREELRLLLILASQYLIGNLKMECIMKLVEFVTPEEFCSLHNLACAYNIPELTIAMANMTTDDVVGQAHILKIKEEIKESQ